jgi:hypothetical protein
MKTSIYTLHGIVPCTVAGCRDASEFHASIARQDIHINKNCPGVHLHNPVGVGRGDVL